MAGLRAGPPIVANPYAALAQTGSMGATTATPQTGWFANTGISYGTTPGVATIPGGGVTQKASGVPGTPEWYAAQNALKGISAQSEASLAAQNNAAVLAAQKAASGEKFAMSAMDALMSKYGPYASGAGGTTGAGGVGALGATIAPPAAPAREAAPALPDTSAADAATWARAKDAISRSTVGAQKTLAEQQAARGFGRESGVYAQEENALNQTGLEQLGETAREQAINNLAATRAAQAADYTGRITQRGQDVSLADTGYGGQITQRGQDLGALQAKYGQWSSLLPSLMALIQNAAY